MMQSCQCPNQAADWPLIAITGVTVLILLYSVYRWVRIRIEHGQTRLLWGIIHTTAFFLLLVVAHGVEAIVVGHRGDSSIIIDYTIAVFALVLAVINLLLVTGLYRPTLPSQSDLTL